MKITITEALQELKTITKRLKTKRDGMMPYVARDSRVKDPMEKEGGSVTFLKREFQSISDLEKRYIRIRSAIQITNHNTSVTVEGITMSIADWMNWRREISGPNKEFLSQLSNGVKKLRGEITRQGHKMVASEAEAAPQDIIVHLDEAGVIKEQETMEKILGDLDGKLSLLNATVLIDIAD